MWLASNMLTGCAYWNSNDHVRHYFLRLSGDSPIQGWAIEVVVVDTKRIVEVDKTIVMPHLFRVCDE